MIKSLLRSIFRTGFCLVLCGLFVTILFSQAGFSSSDDFSQKADRETVRLVPAAFPQLPDPIIRELNNRRCSIPQPWKSSRPQNVVSGEFQQPGQTDWAVLCSANGQSLILVFWGGSADNVEEIPGTLSKDLHWFQGVGEDRIGYSRLITVADDGFLLEHSEYYPEGSLNFVDSRGILGAHADKTSTVHYWHEGRWQELGTTN